MFRAVRAARAVGVALRSKRRKLAGACRLTKTISTDLRRPDEGNGRTGLERMSKEPKRRKSRPRLLSARPSPALRPGPISTDLRFLRRAGAPAWHNHVRGWFMGPAQGRDGTGRTEQRFSLARGRRGDISTAAATSQASLDRPIPSFGRPRSTAALSCRPGRSGGPGCNRSPHSPQHDPRTFPRPAPLIRHRLDLESRRARSISVCHEGAVIRRGGRRWF